MIRTLRFFFAALFIYVSYTVVATSLESNLFEAWSELAAIPWMTATLKDFYALMVPMLLWMCYKEDSWAARGIWAVLFVCLGSIATSGYMLLILLRLPSDAPIEAVLLRKGPL